MRADAGQQADRLRYVIEDQPWIENIHLISVLRTFNALASVTATRDELVRRLQQGEMINRMPFWPRSLWSELLLRQKATKYANLSDGGHIENLGVYELLRLRCRVVIAVDAEWTPTATSATLGTSLRLRGSILEFG